MSRYIDAAAVLLLEHYDMEEAKHRAHVLDARTNQSAIDVVVLACTMSQCETPWWDSDDPSERAIQQLNTTTLLLPSVEALVTDVETALGRDLPGEDMDEKMGRLAHNVPQILAELNGDAFVDPLQGLLAMLQDMTPPTDDEEEPTGADFQEACDITSAVLNEVDSETQLDVERFDDEGGTPE